MGVQDAPQPDHPRNGEWPGTARNHGIFGFSGQRRADDGLNEIAVGNWCGGLLAPRHGFEPRRNEALGDQQVVDPESSSISGISEKYSYLYSIRTRTAAVEVLQLVNPIERQ
jgi:hypothetical protein